MIKLLFLMTGGALGTLARYAASGIAHRMTSTLFPVGTRLLINSILPFLDGNVENGLITMQSVSVIKYQHHQKDG